MRKIAILFLLLAGAVFAGVLDTVWRAPNLGEFMDPYPVVTLADGRQFLQVVRNDTLTCISTKDGSVIWQFDVSDAVERPDTPRRAGILDFNWDGTADFWKIVPGPEGICTLKVVGLEDSFRVNMMLADGYQWVFPVAMRSFSGVLALIPTYRSLYIYLIDFNRIEVFSYTVEDYYAGFQPRLLGVKDDYIGFWGWQTGAAPYGGSAAVAFDINVVIGEVYRKDLGGNWDYILGDGYHCTTWRWGRWSLIHNNYLTDFTVLGYWEEGERFFDGPSGESYEHVCNGFAESSFLGIRYIPSRPVCPKGRFIPNLATVDYFFRRSDVLYFADKPVGRDVSFPSSKTKFGYTLAQDGIIISSEDSIYGVVFNMLFINRGWNLFSNPFAEPLPISEIFDSYISPAYSWNNEDKIYNLTDILAPGQTAWVFSLDSGFVEIPPIPTADSLTYVLYPGWNLIGAAREGALASRITESPAILNAVFGFDPQTNTYFVADTLQPFCGYWVFTTDTITITVP